MCVQVQVLQTLAANKLKGKWHSQKLCNFYTLLHSPAHTKFLKPWLYTYAGKFIYVIGQTDDRELRSMTLTSLVFQCGFTAGSTGYSLQAWLNFSHI